MAAKDFALRLLITARDTATSVLHKLTGSLGTVEDAAAKAAKGIAKIGAAIVGIGTGLATWVVGSLLVQSAKDAESLDRQMRTLEGTIAATGGAAGLTAKQIDAMARRLDEATLGSAKAFRDGANALLTFKSIAGSSYEQILLLAQSLEEAGLGTFRDNVIQLAKALEDPVKGLTALTRSGVTFNETQQKVIKALVETGQKAAAQGKILEAVAGQVAGVAEAAGGGLSGLIDLAAKLGQDIRDQLGAGMLASLTAIQTKITAVLRSIIDSGVAERIGASIGGAFEAVVNGLSSVFDRLDLPALTGQIEKFVTSTGTAVAGWAARLDETLATVSAWGEGISRVVSGVKAVWHGLIGTVEIVAAAFVKGYALMAEGRARFLEGMHAMGLASETSALKARALAETLDELAISYKDHSVEDWKKAVEEATRAAADQASQAGLTADELDALGESAGLTADELDALGESADYAAEGQKSLRDTTEAATTAVAAGVAALREQTESALAYFEALRESGTATTQELVDAWAAYEAALQAQHVAENEAAAKASSSADAYRALAAELKAATEAAAARNDQATRSISLLQQEQELAIAHLEHLAAEARARGQVAEAARIEVEIAEMQLDQQGELAEALAASASAADDYAAALRTSAEADGQLTAEEREAIAVAEDAAAARRLQAEAAAETVRHEQSLADITALSAANTERGADAAERRQQATERTLADEQGITDEQAARDATTPDSSAGTTSAAQGGTALFTIDYERLAEQYGSDIGRLRQAELQGFTAQDAAAIVDEYLGRLGLSSTGGTSSYPQTAQTVNIEINGVLEADEETLEAFARRISSITSDLSRRGGT
jgi:hypothetical protein